MIAVYVGDVVAQIECGAECLGWADGRTQGEDFERSISG